MEDTLREFHEDDVKYIFVVLILVLMEDTLRVHLIHLLCDKTPRVLILVLMEDTLRVCNENLKQEKKEMS